jgi:hypothetical protein
MLMARMQELKDEGMKDDDAYLQARAELGEKLEFKKGSESKLESTTSKNISSAMFVFINMDKRKQISMLEGYNGFTYDDLEAMSSDELFNLYAEKLNNVEQWLMERNDSGLMNPAVSPQNRTPPPPALPEDPLNLFKGG